jgi:hypothetical protein
MKAPHTRLPNDIIPIHDDVGANYPTSIREFISLDRRMSYRQLAERDLGC